MKTNIHSYVFFALMVSVCLYSCTKDITVDLPSADDTFVVEGHIESNPQPFEPFPDDLPGFKVKKVLPYVLLSKNQSYFESMDTSYLNNLFIHDAKMTINGDTLYELCLSEIPDSSFWILPLISGFIGVPVEQLFYLNYCVYMPLEIKLEDPNFIFEFFDYNYPVEIGETYELLINMDTLLLRGITQVEDSLPLDSVWCELQADTLIALSAIMSDPTGYGDYYRITFKSLKAGGEWRTPQGGSAFDDKFIDGQKFDFIIDWMDYYPEDTIIVKFSKIDMNHFDFWRSYDITLQSFGNPFAAPSSVEGNVANAEGIWGAYTSTFDTIFVADFVE